MGQAVLPLLDDGPTEAELIFGALAAGDVQDRSDEWVWDWRWEHHGRSIPIPDLAARGDAPLCPMCGRRMDVCGRLLSAPVALCHFCGAPATIWKAHGDPLEKMYAVVPIPGRPGKAELVDAHVGCVVKMLGHATKVQGFKSQRVHPDCARCAKPWDDHDRYGWETRCCPDWDGNHQDVKLYERAPGLIGPEPLPWLQQADIVPSRRETPEQIAAFEREYAMLAVIAPPAKKRGRVA